MTLLGLVAAFAKAPSEQVAREACVAGDDLACERVLALAAARTVAELEARWAANHAAARGVAEWAAAPGTPWWPDPSLYEVLELDRAAIACASGDLDACPDVGSRGEACVRSGSTDPRCREPAVQGPVRDGRRPRPPYATHAAGWGLFAVSTPWRGVRAGPRALARGVGDHAEVRWLTDPWCHLGFAGDGLVGRRGVDCEEVARLGLDGTTLERWAVPGDEVLGDGSVWATQQDDQVAVWVGGALRTTPGELVGVAGGAALVVRRTWGEERSTTWLRVDAAGEQVLTGECGVCGDELRCEEGIMSWRVAADGARTPIGWSTGEHPVRCEVPEVVVSAPALTDGPVTVVVRGPPGRPVALRAGFPVGVGAVERTVDAARIGPKGRATLHAPAGVHDLSVGDLELFGPGTHVVDVDAAVVVTVTVVDGDGRPVPGAVVHAEAEDQVTGAGGRASLACHGRFVVEHDGRTGRGSCRRPTVTLDGPAPQCRVGDGPVVPCAELAGTLPGGEWDVEEQEGGVVQLVPLVPVVPVLVPDVVRRDPEDGPDASEVHWGRVGEVVPWNSYDGELCASATIRAPGILSLPVVPCEPHTWVRVVDPSGTVRQTPLAADPAPDPEAPPEVEVARASGAFRRRYVPDLLGRVWLPTEAALVEPAGVRREGDRVIVPAAPPVAPGPDADSVRSLLVGPWYDEVGVRRLVVSADGELEGGRSRGAALGRVWAGGAASDDGELLLLLAGTDTLWVLADGPPQRLGR